MSRKFLTEKFQSNSASKWDLAQSIRGRGAGCFILVQGLLCHEYVPCK